MSFIEKATEHFTQYIASRDGKDRFIRESAWEAFMARGLPTRRVENWRYTNLRALNQLSNDGLAGQLSVDDILASIPNEFYRVVLIDGALHSNLSNFEVKWSDKAVSAQLNPDKHPMAVLNLAMSQGGIELFIPSEAKIDKPIVVLHINTRESEGKSHYLNHRINVGEGAQVSLLMHHVNAEKLSVVNNIVVLANLQDNATLGYYSLNASKSDAVHIEGLHVEQQKGSTLDTFILSTGSRCSRVDLSTLYVGERASSRAYGVYSLGEKQHGDIHLNAEHIASHCTTVQSVRGVVDGSAKSVFNGRVCVHQHAVKSFSQQANHNLMLSNTAEVDTKPELEIYNDDVKCAHGATVGQLDQDALFYLLSRGVSKADALKMLRNAFVSQQYDNIQHEEIRDYVMRVAS